MELVFIGSNSLLWSPLDEGSNGTNFDSKRNGLRHVKTSLYFCNLGIHAWCLPLGGLTSGMICKAGEERLSIIFVWKLQTGTLCC